MAAIANDLQVTIEYDSRGKRVTKHFEDVFAGRRWFLAKDRDGKNPRVVNGATPADWHAGPETDELTATVAANAQGRDVGPATLSVPKPQGVNPNATTRALVAGRVLARHGHAAGVTDAMVAEVDAEFGKANAVESEIHLRNAYHAIRGYFETLGMPIPGVAQ